MVFDKILILPHNMCEFDVPYISLTQTKGKERIVKAEEREELYREVRPWGQFVQFPTESPVNLKEITVNSGQRLSLQSHKLRDELWIFPDNGLAIEIVSLDGFRTFISLNPEIRNPATLFILRGWKHRLINNSEKPISMIEIAYGEFLEDDIERFDDDYGRV